MKKRILCYGDSNTWGHHRTDGVLERFDEHTRWPKRLQTLLGEGYEVIEEGLNSRTLCSEYDMAGYEGKNGFTYFMPCMDSHDKVDIVVLMLGTNELKKRFNNTAEAIVAMLDKYIRFIQNHPSRVDGTTAKIVVSGIPLVTEKTNEDYFGAGKKSREVAALYESYCKEKGLPFINNADLETWVDGVHLTAESHAKLAERLAKVLRSI